jgi:hypothetical protein
MVSLKRFEDLRATIEQEKQMLEARLTQIRQALQQPDVFSQEQPVTHKISVHQQRRLDDLMEKNSQGLLSSEEKRELSELAAFVHKLSIANAKALLARKRHREGLSTANGADTQNLSPKRVQPRRRKRVAYA